MKKLVEAFGARVDREKLLVEAVMAYQDGQLVASRRWVPEKPRNIYSQTKSFMATAVGMAISDGMLSLADRPADFFPEALPDMPDERLFRITLRDLLTMSSGLGRDLLRSTTRKRGIGAPDYVQHLFSHTLLYEPGSKFFYSNGDSYLAGRMVEARVGMTLSDYLQQRLLTPLGIAPPEWEFCPLGHTFGASGLQLDIGDMIKLGLLYLQEGSWQGAQLVDPAWIRQATSHQMDAQAPGDDPGRAGGYGYQFWLAPYPGAYRADGLHGQITAVMPEAGAVVAIQSTEAEHGVENIRAALHEEILSQL